MPYAQNPFPSMFKGGMCVTLTTDDPLQFHLSTSPLFEEYTTAKHAWGLSMTDVSHGFHSCTQREREIPTCYP